MTRPQRGRNPFHPLVLGAGAVFALTACSHTVIHLQQLSAAATHAPAPAARPWPAWLDQQGGMLLAVSLILLAVAALADVAWEYAGIRRSEKSPASEDSPESSQGERER